MVRLDISQRLDSRKHNTCGLLMGRRSSRPLCERHGRPAVVKVYHERRELLDRLGIPRRAPRRETDVVTCCRSAGERYNRRLCARR